MFQYIRKVAPISENKTNKRWMYFMNLNVKFLSYVNGTFFRQIEATQIITKNEQHLKSIVESNLRF